MNMQLFSSFSLSLPQYFVSLQYQKQNNNNKEQSHWEQVGKKIDNKL